MTHITQRTFLVLVAAILALGIVSCRSHPVPPQNYDFSPSAGFSHDFDTVWSAVIDYFASQHIGIKNLEKASGLIVAERNFSDALSVYFDCGRRGSGEVFTDARGEFNVFVREVNPDLQRVTVNASYWVNIHEPGGLFRRGGGSSVRACNSTGKLEQLLLSEFEERMEQG